MADYIDRAKLGIGECNRKIFENKSYADGIADYTEYRHNWYPIPSKELATNFSIKQNPLW